MASRRTLIFGLGTTALEAVVKLTEEFEVVDFPCKGVCLSNRPELERGLEKC